jgi:hypothetical protein
MEQVMEIQALGYLGIGTAKLEDRTSLATQGLGMEAVDRGGGTRAFRMDDRRQRLGLDSTRLTQPGILVGKWQTQMH